MCIYVYHWQAVVGTKASISHMLRQNSFHLHDGRQKANACGSQYSLLFHSRLTLAANKIPVSPKYQIHTCQGHANFSCIIPIPNHCNTQPSRDEQLLVTRSEPWPGLLGELAVWRTFQNLLCQMGMSVGVQTCTIGTRSEIPSLWLVS